MKQHKNSERLIGNQNAKKTAKEKPATIYVRLPKNKKDVYIEAAGEIPLPVLVLQLLDEYSSKKMTEKSIIRSSFNESL